MEKTTDKQRRELRTLQKTWNKYHEGLKARDKNLGLGGENSETIQKLFKELEKPYGIINNSLEGLLKITNLSGLSPYTNAILNNESTFLNKMDEIVFQYNAEYDKKIKRTSQLLSTLTIITIIVFLAGFYFLVYPFVKDKSS